MFKVQNKFKHCARNRTLRILNLEPGILNIEPETGEIRAIRAKNKLCVLSALAVQKTSSKLKNNRECAINIVQCPPREAILNFELFFLTSNIRVIRAIRAKKKRSVFTVEN